MLPALRGHSFPESAQRGGGGAVSGAGHAGRNQRLRWSRNGDSVRGLRRGRNRRNEGFSRAGFLVRRQGRCGLPDRAQDSRLEFATRGLRLQTTRTTTPTTARPSRACASSSPPAPRSTRRSLVSRFSPRCIISTQRSSSSTRPLRWWRMRRRWRRSSAATIRGDCGGLGAGAGRFQSEAGKVPDLPLTFMASPEQALFPFDCAQGQDDGENVAAKVPLRLLCHDLFTRRFHICVTIEVVAFSDEEFQSCRASTFICNWPS